MVNCTFLGLSPEEKREPQEREGQSQDMVCVIMRGLKVRPNFPAQALCLDLLEEDTKSSRVQVVALERVSMG